MRDVQSDSDSEGQVTTDNSLLHRKHHSHEGVFSAEMLEKSLYGQQQKRTANTNGFMKSHRLHHQHPTAPLDDPVSSDPSPQIESLRTDPLDGHQTDSDDDDDDKDAKEQVRTSNSLVHPHRGTFSGETLSNSLYGGGPTPTKQFANTNGYMKSHRQHVRRSQSQLYGTPLEPVSSQSSLPRPSYFDSLSLPSSSSRSPVPPKSRLLISDLDNTLFGPSGDGIVARPYLKTFIRYLMHPSTPYALAIWTFSGRLWGQAHLRQAGVGELLFEGEDRVVENPKLREGVLAMWGYEDSGFLPSPPHTYGRMASGPACKDLELMWQLLNIQGHSDWNSLNSLIVDDQISNGRAQPDSIMVCPLFTDKSPDDDFLLAFIGVLDELAPESNFSAVIKRRNFREGIALADLDHYREKGLEVCRNLDIKVSRGTPYHDPAFIETVKSSESTNSTNPVHDAAEEPTEPYPGSFEYGRPVPKRVAKGMPLSPSVDYLKQVSIPSKIGKVKKPLVVFDLDGTLYHRPPQNLEHDPSGQPTGRPYLRSFLQWILRPDSPWTVAIWTGSQKKTAVRCLYELDLGIVGPELIDNEAEILHPKIKAIWAREDFGLTPEDYRSYVAVVKDLNRMTDHLHQEGDGDFDSFNTVMIDDTPSKLRAQPDSLIAAPTFDYPQAPSSETSRYQLDTFLLALVAMLEELAPETNFANYIESQGWFIVIDEKKEKEYEEKGVALLRKAGIAVAAEGRGLIEGTRPSRNEPGYRTKKQYATAAAGHLPGITTSSSSRLTSDALSKVPKNQNPYHSDTSGSDTSESVDGDAEDAEMRSNELISSSSSRR